MATPGSNLSYSGTAGLWRTFFKFFGFRASGVIVPKQAGGTDDVGTSTTRLGNICSKTSATAPTTNSAGDAPTGLRDICVHFNASGVVQGIYVCTAYTSASVHTWTQIR